MTPARTAPYGTWVSPITTDLLLQSAAILRRQMLRWDGPDLYWTEQRPAEGGRNVVCRRSSGGQVTEVTPAGFNARTLVHEYGGGHFAVSQGTVWFTNFADQRLYRQDRDAAPIPITDGPDVRHADMEVDARRRLVFAVREDHAPGGQEPSNSLVAIDATGERAAITIASGRDFYASPRLSPAGDRLSWLSWSHPNMPWDGCELWLGELAANGAVSAAQRIAGGPDESIVQPAWSPTGELYFISDRSGWWNLYRADGARAESICPRAAEFGGPQWAMGMRYYDFAGPDEIVCLWTEAGGTRLGRLNPGDGSLKPIELFYSALQGLQVSGRSAAIFASAPTLAERLLVVDLDTQAQNVVKVSNSAHIEAGYLTVARPIEFATEHGLTAHAQYYAPKNQDFRAPDGELPPLVVECHGGPTALSEPIFPFQYQYLTSRGFAVVTVEYGGSSGFGRAYRNRLKGEWGVVDVDDCINAARHLIAAGLADANRVAITGGSAGGLTVLLSLTQRDFYRAGSSQYGIGNLELFASETHKFESHYMEFLVGKLPQDVELYRQRSAVRFADRLSSPVILFQGLEDKIVPPDQAEEFVAACRAKRLPFAYVTFAGEQHGFRRLDSLRRVIEGELDFFARIFGIVPAGAIEPVTIENLD